MDGIYVNKNGARIEIENGIIKSTGEQVSQELIDKLLASGGLRKITEEADLNNKPESSGDVSSSSSGIYDYSSSRREPAPHLGAVEGAVVDTSAAILFPLSTAMSDISDALPDSPAKKITTNIVPILAGLDAILTYGTVSGYGAVPKAASIGLGGAARVIPNSMRAVAERIGSPSSLSQITKGRVTGESLVNTSMETMQKNLNNAKYIVDDAIGQINAKIGQLKASKTNSPSDKVMLQSLENIKASLGNEIGNLKAAAKQTANNINTSTGKKISNAIQYKPFLPEAADMAGQIGQRAALAAIGKDIAIDAISPFGHTMPKSETPQDATSVVPAAVKNLRR